MNKIAPKVFVYASTLFGFFGLLVVLTLPGDDNDSSDINMLFFKLLLATGFVVLTSFALSIAGKYFGNK